MYYKPNDSYFIFLNFWLFFETIGDMFRMFVCLYQRQQLSVSGWAPELNLGQFPISMSVTRRWKSVARINSFL